MRVPKNTNGRSLTEGKASSLIPSLDPCLLGSIQIGESASNTSFPTPYPGIFKDSSSAHLFEGRTTAWDHLGISEDFGNTIRQFTTVGSELGQSGGPRDPKPARVYPSRSTQPTQARTSTREDTIMGQYQPFQLVLPLLLGPFKPPLRPHHP